MIAPWAGRSAGQWMGVQLLTGFRQQHVDPIPQVDHPDCDGGVASTRHWFNWRQANSVQVFGVRFVRALVEAIAAEGVSPSDGRIERSWVTHPARPNRKPLMDPRGAENVVELRHAVAYRTGANIGRVTDLWSRILPEVSEPYPMNSKGYIHSPYQHLAPYGWSVKVDAPAPGALPPVTEFPRLIVASAHYYCCYTSAHDEIRKFGVSTWPVDPVNERRALVDGVKPGWLPSRSDAPAFTERAFDVARLLAEEVGFSVGPRSAGRWTDVTEYRVSYVVDASVTLEVSLEEFARRAQPISDTVRMGANLGVPPAIPRRPGRYLARIILSRGCGATVVEFDDGSQRLEVGTGLYGK